MYYFDNAATTRAYPDLVAVIEKYLLDKFANPSGLYDISLDLDKDIEGARKTIGASLGVGKDEIYFTPGASWGNNIVLNSYFRKNDKKEVVTSPIEHSSVYKPVSYLSGDKKIRFLHVDSYGEVDLDEIKTLDASEVSLVSIMHVNNELGTVQPIEEIGRILYDKGIDFHVDGVQGYGKIKLDLKKAHVDYFTLSGHKIHGPKGIGALYINSDKHLNPLALGGGQEKGMVPGTENVPGIMALAKAVEIKYSNLEKDSQHMRELNNFLRKGLSEIDGSKVNSPQDGSPYILNVAFKDIRSEVLIHILSDQGFYIAAGSACGKGGKSRTLEAIGLDKDYIDGPVRISFAYYNTMEDAEKLLGAIKEAVEDIRKITKR